MHSSCHNLTLNPFLFVKSKDQLWCIVYIFMWFVSFSLPHFCLTDIFTAVQLYERCNKMLANNLLEWISILLTNSFLKKSGLSTKTLTQNSVSSHALLPGSVDQLFHRSVLGIFHQLMLVNFYHALVYSLLAFFPVITT